MSTDPLSLYAAIPQARQASLARFLEKRKERYAAILSSCLQEYSGVIFVKISNCQLRAVSVMRSTSALKRGFV